MITENLSTLKIHKLTQAQYERELEAGRIDENALYLTPDEEIDLSPYATIEQLNQKANTEHTHDIDDVANLQSSLDQLLEDAKSYTDTTVSSAVNAEHNHDNRYYTEEEIDAKLVGKSDTSHKHDNDYYGKTDGEALAKTLEDVKADVDAFFKDAAISETAKDTLKEIQDYITSDVSAAAEMTASIANKADKTHSHAISDVSGLQSALDGKADSSHGTHVTYSTTAPVMDGTASVGSASTVARSDHKHPTDTSRASKEEFDAHTNNKSNPHSVTLSQLGVNATATELNYTTGVTNNIQSQFNSLSSEIANLKASKETWTFTLEDGSTVTKAVYVG